MIICHDCLAVFPIANIVRNGFRHAFGYELTDESYCPYCGSDAISTAVSCPNCDNGYMVDGEHICARCRRELARKARAFADRLTADEELQFDEWMDGMSITDRKNWR